MQFLCEDLRHAGVVLTPSSPTQATLVNLSGKPIAEWALKCEIEWLRQQEGGGGKRVTGGVIPSLMLPFGMTKDWQARTTYWNAILPGSKRLVSCNPLKLTGDNRDVRQPTLEERWRGSTFSMEGGHREPEPDWQTRARSTKLVLDGVFFADGEFAGPNECQLWEKVIYLAEVYQSVAQTARKLYEAGMEPAALLAEVEKITGKHSPQNGPLHFRGKATAEEFRQDARSSLAGYLSNRLDMEQDEIVSDLVGWADTVLPPYLRVL